MYDTYKRKSNHIYDKGICYIKRRKKRKVKTNSRRNKDNLKKSGYKYQAKLSYNLE